MKHDRNPELIHAYTAILSLGLMLHLMLSGVFLVMRLPAMAWYNLVSISSYVAFLILIHLGFYRLVVTLTHLEACLFICVGTVCLGWDSWFFAYLIAIASLVYFNPYRHQKLIYIFPVLELTLFFALRAVTLHVPPLTPLDGRMVPAFFFINCVSCFGIIMTGTISSKISLDDIRRDRDRMAHDGLTGVYSREYFKEQVERTLRDAPQNDYYLILTNILEFKYFNELFGKGKGDELLLAQARMLRGIASSIAVYGRVSGNEFGILMERSAFREEMLNQLITKVQEQFTTDLYWLRILGGIYRIDNRQEPVDTMLDKAKMTIDSIRGEYNASFAYYDQKMLDKSLYERKLLGEFEHALDNDEFCFFLQPQMTQDGVCCGAEALVRWQHPQRGLIPPCDFLPILEDTGLIWKLDRYIWERVAGKLQQWDRWGREDLSISINISQRDFYYLDIYQVLTSLVETYQIEPNRLKLEITETALMMDVEKQVALLSRLKGYGFEIEIDDFGSGYSSLNTLKDIHADVLKIDMGFLQDTEDNARSWSILTAIMGLSESIGMRTITEGVETLEQLTALVEIGCKLFQGYYFSKPLAVEVFEKAYLPCPVPSPKD